MNKNLKTVLIVGGVFVGVSIIVPLIIGLATGWESSGYGWMGSMMGGFMWFMPVFWLAIIGFIVWAVIAGTQGINKSDSGPKSALDILKERYARGEINKEEFEEKRKDLLG